MSDGREVASLTGSSCDATLHSSPLVGTTAVDQREYSDSIA